MPSPPSGESPSPVCSPVRYYRWQAINHKVRETTEESVSDHTLLDRTRDYGARAFWDTIVRDYVADFDRFYTQKLRNVPVENPVQLRLHLETAVAPVLRDVDSRVRARFYVAPLLLMLYGLVDDAALVVDEQLVGAVLYGSVHVDSIISRGPMRLCVIEATTADLDDACARVVIACELLAERDRAPVVYGIATDFNRWYLYRNGIDDVQREDALLVINDAGVPDLESLGEICSMLYGVVRSDDKDKSA